MSDRKNESETVQLSDLRSKHLDSTVGVYGTIVSVSKVFSRPAETAWGCNRCGTLTRIPQPEAVMSISDAKEPFECQGCERSGPFTLDRSKSEFQDAQSVVLREPLHGAKTDDDRVSLLVDLRSDLTGHVDVGDHVIIQGTLKLTPNERDTPKHLPDKHLEAQSITPSNANEHIAISTSDKQSMIELSNQESVYSDLVDSFAPTIEGHRLRKLAILLQLFSGVRKKLPEGREIRGDIHLLLIGDPGTSKTVLAKQAARLAPRAALVDGSDTSAAGLTSAAAITGGNYGKTPWSIEGGIIAMANEGLACIDDFDQLHSDAQNALHGVLEHQEINASKATEKTSIPAQTSILATANPKYGRFDHYEPIGDQIDFPPQLISEFDLLFVMTDQPDSNEDKKVVDRVLETQYAGEVLAHSQGTMTNSVDQQTVEATESTITPPVDHDLLRKYITHAKQNCYPMMTEEAKEEIRDFYLKMRSRGEDKDAPVPLTARKLEALVRLSEASARMRLSDTVDKSDASRVIEIVRTSMRDIGGMVDREMSDADALEDGQAKSQRDSWRDIDEDWSPNSDDEAKRIVKNIVSDMEMEYDEGAPIETVLHNAEEIGMDRSRAEYCLEKLRVQGDVYEPKTDHLRSV